MQDTTSSITLIQDLMDYAAVKGLTIETLLQADGLATHSHYPASQTQMRAETLYPLWKVIIDKTGESNLGLQLGHQLKLEDLGLLDYVLLNCSTYGQALTKLTRYTQSFGQGFSQGVILRYQIVGDEVRCDGEFSDSLRGRLNEYTHQLIERSFAELFRVTQLLTGNPLTPKSLWFQHPEPTGTHEHRRIFHLLLRFNRPINRLVLASACLGWPILKQSPNRDNVFAIPAEDMGQQLNQRQTYRHRTIQAIIDQLQGELPSLATVAQQLKVNIRQLQIGLAQEGISLEQLLDATRRELALRHLKNPDCAIYDLAFLLGCDDLSDFNRLFQRWTGLSPKVYRIRHSANAASVLHRRWTDILRL